MTTAIDKFCPKLTHDEVFILYRCPYDNPKSFVFDPALRRRANKLVRLGLLERCKQSGAVTLYRCTDDGDAVFARFRQLGWIESKRWYEPARKGKKR
jgi:hypothetical protein